MERRIIKKKMGAVIVLLMGGLLAATTGQAALVSSAADGDWNVGGTWTGGAIPVPGDTVVIDHLVSLGSSATVGSTTVNSTLTFNGWTTELNSGSVFVNSGGVITHDINTDTTAGDGWTPDNRIQIMATDLTVAAGGEITADAMGYQANSGPGTGTGSGGAGHGGQGGPGVWTNTGGGPSYGAVDLPIEPGSGGAGAGAHPGGGAIWIEALDMVTIDGIISANGQGQAAHMYNAGGSGGSIFISTHDVQGAGSLTATGGGQATPTEWKYNHGGGAGGRISLVYFDYLVDPGFVIDMSGGIVLGDPAAGKLPGTGESGTLAIVNLPEPTSLILLAASGICMLWRRR